MHDDFEKDENEIKEDSNPKEQSTDDLDETLKMLEKLINSQDASLEDIEKLLNEAEGNIQIKVVASNKKQSFFKLIGSFFYELIVSFILIFTINSLFNIVDTNLLILSIFVLTFVLLDFSFNSFIKRRFPIISLMSFGAIHLIVSVCSITVAVIVTLQFGIFDIKNIGLAVFIVLAFLLIRKFVFEYFKNLKSYLKIRKGK